MKLKPVALLLVTSFIFISQSFAETFSGKVVAVADGDTITVLSAEHVQLKVRLSGIDAPEKKQAFGNVSKKSLSDLVYDKQVVIDFHKQDQYDRTVGKVIVNGIDANLEQVKRGMAWFYKKYQNELTLDDRLGYLHAHEQAEASGTGLWSDKEAIAPWEFRKLSRKN